MAHSLAGIPDPPPITLLFYKAEQLEQWKAADQRIQLTTKGVADKRDGFDSELVRVPQRSHGQVLPYAEADRLRTLRNEGMTGEELFDRAEIAARESNDVLMEQSGKGPPIKHLILTVKASGAVASLMSVKKRLGPDSSILFMCNGMGIIEEVNEKVFPDPETRPKYMLGITSHGVNRQQDKPFEPTHAGFGTVSIGLAPQLSTPPTSPAPGTDHPNPNMNLDMVPSSQHLLQTLTRTPVLAAVAFSPIELLKSQLDKLAVNAVLNPLTALLDCRNGALLYNYSITRVMRLILTEVSAVFTSLPELRGQPNINTRFGPERLETLCVGVANRTADNISSMLQDVRAGKKTEIEYINGFVVRKGEELGITAAFNYMVQQMVLGKQQMINDEEEKMVPFVEEQIRIYEKEVRESS